MNFVIGLVLIYAIAVIWGAAQPASLCGCRSNSLRWLRKPSKASLTVHGSRAGGRRWDPSRATLCSRYGDTSVSDFSDMAAAVQNCRGNRSGRDQARRPNDDQIRRHHPEAALGY